MISNANTLCVFLYNIFNTFVWKRSIVVDCPAPAYLQGCKLVSIHSSVVAIASSFCETELLKETASEFKHGARRIHLKFWWQNVKLWIILITIILVILAIIISESNLPHTHNYNDSILICVYFFCSCDCSSGCKKQEAIKYTSFSFTVTIILDATNMLRQYSLYRRSRRDT